MRDIIFRAFWKDTLKPIEDFNINYTIDSCNSKVFIINQYTGLKDKNGVEIYEGDICKVFIKTGGMSEKKEGFMYGVVKYLHNKFVIKAIKYEGDITSVFGEGKIYGFLDYNFNDLSKIEIIGNIHQNPELL